MKTLHYASLTVNGADLYGTAELTGGGYLFRQDGERQATLIRSQDVNRPYRLMLFGRVDLADAQYIDDEIRGGAAAICTSRQQGMS